MTSIDNKFDQINHAEAVLTTYGLNWGGASLDVPGFALTVTEFTFVCDEESGNWQVIAWTGSWPFAFDYPMGNLETIEEAARYAKWLSDRERFYYERDEKMIAEMEASRPDGQ